MIVRHSAGRQSRTLAKGGVMQSTVSRRDQFALYGFFFGIVAVCLFGLSTVVDEWVGYRFGFLPLMTWRVAYLAALTAYGILLIRLKHGGKWQTDVGLGAYTLAFIAGIFMCTETPVLQDNFFLIGGLTIGVCANSAAMLYK
jgi:hypothetical protein